MGPLHESAAMPPAPVIWRDCNASDHAPPIGGEVSNHLPTLSNDYDDGRCPV